MGQFISFKSEINNPWFNPWFILLHTHSDVCATVEGRCLEYLVCITLVQTWKRKTRKWAAKFQVYFKKSIFFLSSIAIQKTRGDLQSLTEMTINHNSKCLLFWACLSTRFHLRKPKIYVASFLIFCHKKNFQVPRIWSKNQTRMTLNTP